MLARATPEWVPAGDLAELDDHYVLTVQLPGLDRSDITIDHQGQVLTVRGTRPADSSCPERYQQLERGQGPFSRSFRFAMPVAVDGIHADLADGVLTIVIPKDGERGRIPIG